MFIKIRFLRVSLALKMWNRQDCSWLKLHLLSNNGEKVDILIKMVTQPKISVDIVESFCVVKSLSLKLMKNLEYIIDLFRTKLFDIFWEWNRNRYICHLYLSSKWVNRTVSSFIYLIILSAIQNGETDGCEWASQKLRILLLRILLFSISLRRLSLMGSNWLVHAFSSISSFCLADKITREMKLETLLLPLK